MRPAASQGTQGKTQQPNERAGKGVGSKRRGRKGGMLAGCVSAGLVRRGRRSWGVMDGTTGSGECPSTRASPRQLGMDGQLLDQDHREGMEGVEESSEAPVVASGL